MCYYTASYLKSQFYRPGGVFWPFLDPREAKKGKKKVNRQTSEKKNYRQKKRTNAGYFVEKKSWLYDNYPQSYIRLLLRVFFVPTRYNTMHCSIKTPFCQRQYFAKSRGVLLKLFFSKFKKKAKFFIRYWFVGIWVTRGEYRMHINMEFKSSLYRSFENGGIHVVHNCTKSKIYSRPRMIRWVFDNFSYRNQKNFSLSFFL